MKLLFTIVFVLCLTQSHAQEDKVLIPSPEAASLIKWSKNDVNLSTGTINTMIPIYTLKDGDLEVPIALHYNGSSGIKVTESASLVGLGWDLVAGGKIVRIVRDKPDESFTINDNRNEKGGFDGLEIGVEGDPTGLIGQSSVSVQYKNKRYNYRAGWFFAGDPITDSIDFEKNDPVLYDGQPDIFIVNIGSDMIKFTFDKYGTPVITNNKDYKIEIDYVTYSPSIFLTKQNWALNVNIGIGEAMKSITKSVKGLDKFLPTTLGATIGLDQFARGSTNNYPTVIGFQGFKITAANGIKYYFGGSEEFLEYNFNDQAYLLDTDALAIAVNNLSQRIPYAWALRKIESPFGANKNCIDFTYKRTGYYEPFGTSDNKVNAENACDVPKSKQDKLNINIFGNLSVSDSIFTNYVGLATAGTIDFSYKRPSKEDLAAYVTLNTRVIFGLYPETIKSPNFKITFNANDLLFAPINVTNFKNIIPGFNPDSFIDVERKDSRPEGSLSTEEEKNKGLFTLNADGSMVIKRDRVTVASPGIATVALNGLRNPRSLDSLARLFKGNPANIIKSIIPSISYQGDGISATLNGNGAYINWSGKIYKIDLQGEFKEVMVPNLKLKNMEVLDLNTFKKKGFYFDYDYFDAYVNPNYPNDIINRENAKLLLETVPDPGVISDLPKGMYPQLHEKYGLYYTEDKFRLKLKGVYELYYKDSVVNIMPGTTFKYNLTPLPRRLSYAHDYWGYYNGQHDNRNKTQSVSVPTYVRYNDNLTYESGEDGNPYCANGSDLRPNVQFAQAGILNEIQYSTGAKKEFKYELHAANDYFGKVGGLRVKEIVSYEPVGLKTYFEKFKYKNDNGKSSGVLAIIPDYVFVHTKGNNTKKLILPNYSDQLGANFLNDGYISYEKVTKYDSSSLGNLNGYTEFYFSNLESNPKRKNQEVETVFPLYAPRNIYQVIPLSAGGTANSSNVIVDIDQITSGIQTNFEKVGEGYWALDNITGMLTFTPYVDNTVFPSALNFDYYETGNPTKFTKSIFTIPYNNGQGPKITGYNVENAFFRVGGIPRYDYSKNSLKKISVFNNQNQLVNLKEYFYTGILDNNKTTARIVGINIIGRIPITKFSVGISFGIFFGATVIRPEIGIAAQDRIVKSAEIYPYYIDVERYDLLTERETMFDVNGQNPVVSEKTYTYSLNHHNPIETSMRNSKDQYIINKTLYSFDIDTKKSTDTVNTIAVEDLAFNVEGSNYTDLYTKYINLPIEQISMVDSMVVGSSFLDIYPNILNFENLGLPKVQYALEIDAPIPFAQFRKAQIISLYKQVFNTTYTTNEYKYFPYLLFDLRYKPVLFMDEYNSRGLPSKYHKRGDPFTQVSYGFNDLIPISKTLAFDTPLARTTLYEYIPLYGLKQMTNPNLTAQKYDYDELGRLKAVRNTQNEILKSYVYKILGF